MLLFICPLLWLSYALAGIYIPNTPPVLIWGIDLGSSRSIFQPLRSADFFRLLKPLWRDHMFIIYISPELTSKDFNIKNSYPLTRRILPRTYYSQVQNPLKTLEKIGEIQWPEKHSTSTLTTELRTKICCQLREVYAFNLTDRHLLEHDAFIYNVTEHLEKCSIKVLHIYTSHNELASVLRRRRWRRSEFKLVAAGDQIREIVATETVEPRLKLTNLTVLRHDLGILAVRKIVVAVEILSGTVTYYDRTTIVIDSEGDPLALALIDPQDVQKGVTLMLKTNMGYLTITLLPFDGNWLISRMSLNGNTTFSLLDMPFFDKKFSYCCGVLNSHSNNGTRLTLYSFYLDIITNDADSGVDPDYVPKPCWSCEQFLTSNISQAIFTLIILVAILGVGVIMIWDIGRNKRMQNANQPDLHIKTAG